MHSTFHKLEGEQLSIVKVTFLDIKLVHYKIRCVEYSPMVCATPIMVMGSVMGLSISIE